MGFKKTVNDEYYTFCLLNIDSDDSDVTLIDCEGSYEMRASEGQTCLVLRFFKDRNIKAQPEKFEWLM